MIKLNVSLSKALSTNCCQQNSQFYELCYKILQEKIHKIVCDFSPTNAKDLTQDIFLKILELDINKLKPHADYIERYLLSIAKNYCRSYYTKKKKVMEGISEYQIQDRVYQPSLSFKMDLEDAFRNIPERQAIAVKMKSEDFKIKEIAEALDTSEGAVKTLIYNGRRKLKKYLKD